MHACVLVITLFVGSIFGHVSTTYYYNVPTVSTCLYHFVWSYLCRLGRKNDRIWCLVFLLATVHVQLDYVYTTRTVFVYTCKL